jgi:hypothetical protein
MPTGVLAGFTLVKPKRDQTISLHDHRPYRHLSRRLSPFRETDTQIHPVAVSSSGVISRQELHLRVR